MTYQYPDNTYPSSVNELPDGRLYMVDMGDEDGLFYAGENCPFTSAKEMSPGLFHVDMNRENARILWKLFPWTGPSQVLGKERTFGCGDRLGIATVGHIRSVSKYDVYPIFAQQSLRELHLMGNTYDDVLTRVTYQVLQAGYRKGYGADGDHLMHKEDILAAIDSGVSMITLDCSEHIHSDRTSAPLSEELIERYLSGDIVLPGATLHFTEQTLAQAQAVYGEAIEFAKTIYHECIEGKPVDLEISMDETDETTTAEQHFFTANELTLAGVKFCTMAPRFCGEFQKGIDYIGDLNQFREEMIVHQAIASHLGYKISVHSGSDKFSVFESVGELTGEHFHLKTSGTSWLEALRLVSQKDPALFREIYAYAKTVFEECRAYYVVWTELSDVPDITLLSDEKLPDLLNIDTSRQLLHITYGKTMNQPQFRGPLYRLWRKERAEYALLLEKHMDRHLQPLTAFL